MKARVAFNMLNFAKRLKEIGVEPKLAEAQAQVTLEVIVGLLEENLATKQDFQLARQELMLVKSELLNPIAESDHKLTETRSALEHLITKTLSELERQIIETKAALNDRISRLETTLTIRLGAIMAGSMVIVGTIGGIILHFLH